MRTFKVTSKSDPSKSYVITKDDNGKYAHDGCKGFLFRGTCSHIKAIQEDPLAYEVGGNVGRTPNETMKRKTGLPAIVVGHVDAVLMDTDACLVPQIPAGQSADITGLLATIACDLLKHGYSWGAIRERFTMIPDSWGSVAVQEHVKESGRTTIKYTQVGNEWTWEFVVEKGE